MSKFSTIQIHEETKNLLKKYIIEKFGSNYFGKMSEVVDKAILEYIRRHA